MLNFQTYHMPALGVAWQLSGDRTLVLSGRRSTICDKLTLGWRSRGAELGIAVVRAPSIRRRLRVMEKQGRNTSTHDITAVIYRAGTYRRRKAAGSSPAACSRTARRCRHGKQTVHALMLGRRFVANRPKAAVKLCGQAMLAGL